MQLHEPCAKGESFLGELNQPQAMFILARKDLRAAITLTAQDDADTEIVGFHTQQAVEKALKGWLEFCGIDYSKTHDLTMLLTQLTDHGMDVEPFRSIEELSPFAVQYRYELYEEESMNWEKTHQQAKMLIEHVESLLQTKKERNEPQQGL